MEFILDAQAKHAAAIQQHEVMMRELDQKISTLTDLVGRLAQAEIHHVERTQALEANMNKLFERMDRFIQGLGGNGHKSP